MKPLAFFRSIRTKTALLFFLVFVVIVLPVNFFIYQRVAATLRESDTRELLFEADKLLNQTRLEPKIIPLPREGYNIKIQLYENPYFHDIFTSPGFPETDPAVFQSQVYEIDTMKWVTISKEIEYATGSIFLSLAHSNRGLEEQLSGLKAFLFAANAAALLIAGFLVFIITGITLRPVQNIAAVTQRINASNSIERVPVPKRNDEIRVLAETINAMLSRMESSIKDQTNFFASAAHELKTPLAIMQTELSLALTQMTDRDTRRILESNLAEVQRLDRVIHDFLLISQLRSDTLILRKKMVHPGEILYSALKKIKYLSSERGILINVNVDETMGDFQCELDFDKIETVAANLMENAIRYNSEDTVHVTIGKLSGTLCLRVTNPVKDVIINTDELKSEFKKSIQYSTGLGMGLWICDRIVQMHDGELQLKQQQGKFEATVVI